MQLPNGDIITNYDQQICELRGINNKQYNRFCNKTIWESHPYDNKLGCLKYTRLQGDYGLFKWSFEGVKYTIGSHRLYNEFRIGRILDSNEFICHTPIKLGGCGNTTCMSCTRVGDYRLNANDKILDNLNYNCGEDNGMAVMDWHRVTELRMLRNSNPFYWTQKRLAERYGIGNTTVHLILTNQTWRV